MKHTRMIQAVVFDFDGLILDTEYPEYVSWREIYQAHGANLPLSAWERSIGSMDLNLFDPYAYLEAQLGQPVDRAEIRARRRPRFAELVAAQSVLPGVEDYLAGARRLGLKVGLASSSSRAWVTGHLARFGLNGATFDCLYCGDEVKRTKPDPDLYLAVLGALAVRGDQAVALEDSPNGVAAAKAAGLYCVAVPNMVTRRLAFDQADLRLNSLAEMPLEKLLEEVERNGR
jgi:HAD superfamily hydrolase (TIGR01509 family)